MDRFRNIVHRAREVVHPSDNASIVNEDDLFTSYPSRPIPRNNSTKTLHKVATMLGLNQAKDGKHKSTRFMTILIFVAMLLFLVIFVSWFAFHSESFSNSNPDSNPTLGSNIVNGIYYWSTLTSTVGFGDICPKTPSSKGITVIYQVILTLASLGLLWKVTDKHFDKLGSEIRNSVGKIPLIIP